MADAEEAVAGRRFRQWRSVSEKRQIVQMTLEPGASVAEVARTHGLNANQLFKWRRAFERGELVEPYGLLPVTISSPSEPAQETAKGSIEEQASSGGAIHIEFPGRAVISVERGADPTLLRFILESLRK
jgi:transposase